VLQDLQVVALAPQTVRFLAAASAVPARRTDTAIPAALRADVALTLRQMRDTHHFNTLYLLGGGGTVRLATDERLAGHNYVSAPYFLSAKAGAASFDEPRYDPEEGRIYLHVSAPVHNPDGTVVGVAVGQIPLSSLDDIVAGDTGFAGRGEYGVLWDGDGVRLSQPSVPDLRLRPLAPLAADAAARIEAEDRFGPGTAHRLTPARPVPQAVERSQWLLYDSSYDPFLRFEGEDGETVHGAVAPLKTQRWLYGIFSPESAMLAEVARQTRGNLLLALIMALLAVVLGLGTARWAAAPLRLVGGAAEALASGDMSRRVRLAQRDEVGRLGDAFDTMAEALAAKDAELRGHADSLEQRVAEQTAALRASEEELRVLFQSEQEARRKAEEANRIKDEFLSTVSHELRTPLNAILGWTWLLASKQMDAAEHKRAVATIERNARAQSQIIDDLLDVSRIITGKLRLKVRRLDLVQVIEAAVDSIRPAAEAKAITLDIQLDPAAARLSGDPGRLQQVVWNLLSNAVKFTPSGGRVEVRLDEVGNNARLAVKDSGMGIRPDFLDYVFDRFRQADSSTTRTHGGLGLGLSIVRHLVELHGGTVAAESPGDGQGATFTVLLPMAARPLRTEPVPEPPHPAGPAPEDGNGAGRLDGRRILVVDDERDALEVVSAALEQLGAQVAAAGSAAEAMAEVRRFAPDVLVADIGMPGEDGYSLIRRIRQLDGGLGSLPAVALTAYAGEADRQRALSAGYQLHLPKPVEPHDLAAAVATLTERSAGRPG
jgi:signal transduction histidine kinase/ActR/RegA family two-component response regulator